MSNKGNCANKSCGFYREDFQRNCKSVLFQYMDCIMYYEIDPNETLANQITPEFHIAQVKGIAVNELDFKYLNNILISNDNVPENEIWVYYKNGTIQKFRLNQ